LGVVAGGSLSAHQKLAMGGSGRRGAHWVSSGARHYGGGVSYAGQLMREPIGAHAVAGMGTALPSVGRGSHGVRPRHGGARTPAGQPSGLVLPPHYCEGSARF
jgi:hypothetical protein